MEMSPTSGHSVPLMPIRSTSDIFVATSLHGDCGAPHEVEQCSNDQACRGYEIIHPYPYPYPQIFRGYPWIYPYPQMPIIYRLTYRPMH